MRIPQKSLAVFKRQAINLRSCCTLLVDSVESTMMHGLANSKPRAMLCLETRTGNCGPIAVAMHWGYYSIPDASN